MNLLVVEDEARVADFLQRGLKGEGWTVTLAGDGESALQLLNAHEFDLVVLDLMLPGISGQDVCRRMRAKRNFTPVLMLTALDQTDDRVSGLRLGADDYLGKPFSFDELVARIDALVRRAQDFQAPGLQPHVLSCGLLTYDTKSLDVTCGERPIKLTAKERDILKLFLSNPDTVLSRERILNAVWGLSEDPLTNVIDVYVGRLRKKIGASGCALDTIRGAGYKLSAGAHTPSRATGPKDE